MTILTHLPPSRQVGMHRQERLSHHTQEIVRPPGYVPNWNGGTPTDPIKQMALAESRVEKGLRATPPPSVPKFIPAKPKRKFWQRMRSVWEWFTLSATTIFFSFVLLAGGIFAAKTLIFLFQELLGGHLQQ